MVSYGQSSDLKYTSKITDALTVLGSTNPETLNQVKQKFKGCVIGTHSDTFHCDEVLACTMLLYTDNFSNSVIVRTRDQEVLNTLDILVDVGAEYIPEKLRFDHHQKSFSDTWDNTKDKYKGIRLSSAGLIYKHYGREVIRNATKHVWGQDLTNQEIEQTYELLYKKLILEVDAIDNGVSEAPEMRYKLSTGLASRVGRLNPDWFEPNDGNTQHVQFKKAMFITEEELLWKLKDLTQSRLIAYNLVKKSFDSRIEFHKSGEIMLLHKFCPWKGILLEIEKELNCEGQIKFVIFSDGNNGSWRIATVPPSAESFDMRVPLKADWRGIREKELQQVSGFEDAIFVHMSGFIGGCKSQQSAVRMAELSIEAHNISKQV